MEEAKKGTTGKVKKAVPGKAERACGLCGKTNKLTKTECCNNWICDDYDQYVMFSYARNSCYRNHDRYTLCSYHYHEGHVGKWQDCGQCKQGMGMVHYVDCATNDYNFEKLENVSKVTITCSNCEFKSKTLNNFPLTVFQGSKMDFFCKKEKCQNAIEEAKKRSMVGNVERAVPKKAERACGLCGKTKKLTKTKCCNNWICDDYDQYVMFSYARNSCYRNHEKYTLCSFHHQLGHDGKWQDCEQCKQGHHIAYYVDYATNDCNFEKLENVPEVTITCSNCEFKSDSLDDFPLITSQGLFGKLEFFCKKVECQNTKGEVKKISTTEKVEKAVSGKIERAVPKKAERRACGLCGKTKKLTKTECCNNWICDDSDQYVLFSYARNSCYRNHDRYTMCSYHYHGGHDGKWQDCKRCKQEMSSLVYYVDGVTNDYNFEKLENVPKVTITCSNCRFKSESLNDFPSSVSSGGNTDYFCKKMKCQKKSW